MGLTRGTGVGQPLTDYRNTRNTMTAVPTVAYSPPSGLLVFPVDLVGCGKSQ